MNIKYLLLISRFVSKKKVYHQYFIEILHKPSRHEKIGELVYYRWLITLHPYQYWPRPKIAQYKTYHMLCLPGLYAAYWELYSAYQGLYVAYQELYPAYRELCVAYQDKVPYAKG